MGMSVQTAWSQATAEQGKYNGASNKSRPVFSASRINKVEAELPARQLLSVEASLCYR
jgi:hypothetical protein